MNDTPGKRAWMCLLCGWVYYETLKTSSWNNSEHLPPTPPHDSGTTAEGNPKRRLQHPSQEGPPGKTQEEGEGGGRRAGTKARDTDRTGHAGERPAKADGPRPGAKPGARVPGPRAQARDQGQGQGQGLEPRPGLRFGGEGAVDKGLG